MYLYYFRLRLRLRLLYLYYFRLRLRLLNSSFGAAEPVQVTPLPPAPLALDEWTIGCWLEARVADAYFR